MIAAMLRVALMFMAIALCGCRDKQLAEIKKVRDLVCACKDVACGEAAMKRVPRQSGSPGHKAQQLASEMMTCMSKLYLKDTRPDDNPDSLDLLPSDAGGLRINWDARDKDDIMRPDEP